MFSCEFSKISKNTFFPEHIWTTASAFSFSEGKHLWFAKFSKTPFSQDTSGRLLLAFSCNVTKIGYCQQWMFGKHLLPRKTNLRIHVLLYHFFFWQDKLSVFAFIGLHCLLQEAAIRVAVFSKKRCSYRFRKFYRKTSVLESPFKVAGLTSILKNICQRLLLHCTRTTHYYLYVSLYIQHHPHHHCFYC